MTPTSTSPSKTSSNRAAQARLPKPVRRDLAWIWRDGVSWSVMVGLGESYLAAFTLACGHGETASGLIASAPLLAGAAIQLAAPALAVRMGSLKKWVVLAASLQALVFLPLAFGAWTGGLSLLALFALATAYWAFGLGTGPAWNTWVGGLVPRSVKAGFFASRTRASQVGTFVGLATAGVLLRFGPDWFPHLPALGMFALIFLAACLARSVSAACLAQQETGVGIPAGYRALSFGEFARRITAGGEGRFVRYVVAVQLAAQVAGPYYTPFMLKEIGFDYFTYMSLLATALLGRVVALPFIGMLAKRQGVHATLRIGGIGVVFATLLWALSQNLPYLYAVQFASGAVWACYELSTFLLFFDAIPAHERTSMLSWYNFLHSAATLCGALLGGWLLQSFGHDYRAYVWVFTVSSVLRAGTLVLLWRLGRVSAEVVPMSTRPLSVSPATGGMDRPIITTLDKDESATKP